VSATDELAAAWRDARAVVVLTGAGLSTASGIPDFRSPGGRWSRYRPVTIQEFLASEDDRARYWRYKGETWEVIQAAAPNPGHVALAELAHAGGWAARHAERGRPARTGGFPAGRLVSIQAPIPRSSACAAGGASRGGAARMGGRRRGAVLRLRQAVEAGDDLPSASRSSTPTCAARSGPRRPALLVAVVRRSSSAR
jgi:hypothetical protein